MKPFSLLVFLPEGSHAPFRELGYDEAARIAFAGGTTLACFVCGKERPTGALYTITPIFRRYLVPLCSEDADRAITRLGDWCSPLDEVVRDALHRYNHPLDIRPGMRSKNGRSGFSIADTAAAVKLLRLRFALELSDN